MKDNKQAILNAIKANPHADGIELCELIRLPVVYGYILLHELERDGLINKVYVGLRTCYVLVEGE